MTIFARRDFRLLALLGDLVALALSFQGAVALRLVLNPLFTKQLTADQIQSLVPPIGLILILWIVAGGWIGLYQPRTRPFLASAAAKAAEAMVLVVTLTIVAAFFVRDLGRDYSRSFIVFLVALGVLALLLNRALLWMLASVMERRGVARERLLLVGSGQATKDLIGRLEILGNKGVRICGVVTPKQAECRGVLGNPVPIVGTIADLAGLINAHRIDRVVAVEEEIPSEEMRSCLSVCTRMGVPFNYTANQVERASVHVGSTELGGTLLIEVRSLEFTRLQEIVKRIFDLVAATILLLVAAPLMILLAALIRLTSPGPVFYVAPRVGRGGRYFHFIKFRSMVEGADGKRGTMLVQNEKDGHIFKVRRDPRVTGIGKFMRRFSLDELPQLFNVLCGHMSLVGPRPLPARDLEPDGLSREYRVWAVQRTKVPPGITGLWQIRGRSDLSFEEMLRLDIAYVRHWSIWLDLKILTKTLPAALWGRGAC